LLLKAQNSILSGKVTDEAGVPIAEVQVFVADKAIAKTNEKGFFYKSIPIAKRAIIRFQHIAYEGISKSIELLENNKEPLTITLFKRTEKLKEVVVEKERIDASGTVVIQPTTSQKLPSPTMGIENVLMTLPGVNNNNELSSQYNVRGGNFDENLLYINGIEVYRPFLIRAGQQEGLSVINSAMVENIKFSAGGFQAIYGDRLSSVLDITYRTPKQFKLAADASFLGGAITAEGTGFNEKLSVIAGARYRNNSLFVNSKETETNTNPTFWDAQIFISYEISKKLSIDFLGNFSINDYQNEPKNRRTRFGTLASPIDLIVKFQGEENNSYQTLFGALNAHYQIDENFELKLTSSLYETAEEEKAGVLAAYNLDEVNQSNAAEEQNGAQLNYYDNQLEATIANVQLRGEWKFKSKKLLFGLKHQQENYKDQLKEVEQIDTSGDGLSINYQENLLTSVIRDVDAFNNVTISRNQFFVQLNNRLRYKKTKIWYNMGARAHHWRVNANDLNSSENTVYSIRSQFAVKPSWKKDMLFRVKGGMYHQPPNYREIRANDGSVVPTVDAQSSLQLALSNEYRFEMMERPFKLSSELYYKHLTNVNTYTIENVRIRYDASNSAKAYAYGADFRLNGEFVPGTQSWLSVGFLRTQEQKDQFEFTDRPTDQRFKFAMLFQDYMPNFPNVKMYLNMVYNSGLPTGSPSYVNASEYQQRMNPYRRADIGIFYEVVGASKEKSKPWYQLFRELEIGIQLFNLFDVQNAITNTWVRDVFSNRFYAVPNYMTGRVLNLKLHAEF